MRTLRIGPVWDDARHVAAERGETITTVVERYLRRYVAAHRRDTGSGDGGGQEQ